MSKSVSTWGRNIVIVYALFACGTLAFVGFAMTQRVDLTSEHYYEDALRNDEISAARYRARQNGAVIQVQDSLLYVSIPAELAADGAVTLQFFRSDDPGLDRTVVLSTPTDDTYGTSISGFRNGVWRLRASWRSQSKDVQIDTAIRVTG